MAIYLPRQLAPLGALVQKDSLRWATDAVHVIDPGDGTFRAEATDGRKLAVVRGPNDPADARTPPPAPNTAQEFLVPAELWRRGFRLGDKLCPKVVLAGSEREIVLACGGDTVRQRLHTDNRRYP